MADDAGELATTEGDRSDLEGLHDRRDGSAAGAHDRRGVEDAGVGLVLPEEEHDGLRARDGLHVVTSALREERERTHEGRVQTHRHVGRADELVAGVDGAPLAIDEGHRIGRLRQRRICEGEVPPVNREDIRGGLEVDFAESGHERFLLLTLAGGLTT